MSQENPLHILFLASWYPSKKEPTLGIFIKRHAQAVASINKVSVLHAIADNDLKEGEFRIERKSEGIHHIAFDVADIYAEMSRLKAEGFEILNEVPKKGADNKIVVFLHPKSTNGVLVELCQTNPNPENL